MDRVFYPSYDRNWDDALFRRRVLPKVGGAGCVLDLGAGAGIVEAMNFRGIARKVIGVDLDPRVVNNPFLDESFVADVAKLPIRAESCDAVLADNVLEHLEHPEEVFREAYRVLRPGGRFFIKTPNKSHYVALIASATPHWFHRLYNAWRGRESDDTFRTQYRANSEQALRRLAASAGFEVCGIELVEGRPEYLRKLAAFYLFGLLYERLVNASEKFRCARVLIIGEFRRPSPEKMVK
jgi:SAM-dependent methyltransferase